MGRKDKKILEQILNKKILLEQLLNEQISLEQLLNKHTELKQKLNDVNTILSTYNNPLKYSQEATKKIKELRNKDKSILTVYEMSHKTYEELSNTYKLFLKERLNLEIQIEEIQPQIDNIKFPIEEIKSQINNIESQIEELESQIDNKYNNAQKKENTNVLYTRPNFFDGLKRRFSKNPVKEVNNNGLTSEEWGVLLNPSKPTLFKKFAKRIAAIAVSAVTILSGYHMGDNLLATTSSQEDLNPVNKEHQLKNNTDSTFNMEDNLIEIESEINDNSNSKETLETQVDNKQEEKIPLPDIGDEIILDSVTISGSSDIGPYYTSTPGKYTINSASAVYDNCILESGKISNKELQKLYPDAVIQVHLKNEHGDYAWVNINDTKLVQDKDKTKNPFADSLKVNINPVNPKSFKSSQTVERDNEK